jgi:hypothetical protein
MHKFIFSIHPPLDSRASAKVVERSSTATKMWANGCAPCAVEDRHRVARELDKCFSATSIGILPTYVEARFPYSRVK